MLGCSATCMSERPRFGPGLQLCLDHPGEPGLAIAEELLDREPRIAPDAADDQPGPIVPAVEPARHASLILRARWRRAPAGSRPAAPATCRCSCGSRRTGSCSSSRTYS